MKKVCDDCKIELELVWLCVNCHNVIIHAEADHLAALAEKDKWIAEVKMWAKNYFDAEKQRCQCGKYVGFMLPHGTVLKIQEDEKQIAALEAQVKEKERTIGFLHRKMTSPRITEMEQKIAALTVERDRLRKALKDLVDELLYDMSNSAVALKIAQAALKQTEPDTDMYAATGSTGGYKP
jgi:hypothetical protein